MILMAIADGIMRKIGLTPTPRLSSWRTHIQQDHYPFRKDCQVCQEAAAKGAPHYRQKVPPRAGVLSLDITGPFQKARDLERGTYAKYILAGAVTWPSGGVGPDVEPEDLEEPHQEAPPLVELEEDPPGRPKRGRPRERRPDDDSEDDGDASEVADENDEEEIGPEVVDELPIDDLLEAGGDDQQEEPQKEENPKTAQMTVYRLAIPLESRAQGVVLRGIIDLVLMLRSEGIHVTQLHTDRGGEFRSKRLRTWCRERNVLQTWTAGDKPQSNGRAEKAVQDTKRRVRVLLHAAGVGEEYWPIAVRNVNERWRIGRLGKPDRIPPFLAEVLIKKRCWRERDLEPVQERVRYLCPS